MSNLTDEAHRRLAGVLSCDGSTIATLENTSTLDLIEHTALSLALRSACWSGALSSSDTALASRYLGEPFVTTNGGWAAETHIGARLATLDLLSTICHR